MSTALDIRAAKQVYKDKLAAGTLIDIPLREQAEALADEVAHSCAVLDERVKADRVHPTWAAIRKRRLQAVLATVQALQQALEADHPEATDGR